LWDRDLAIRGTSINSISKQPVVKPGRTWDTHKVEAGHQQHKVDKQKPMALESDLSFLDKGLANAASMGLAQLLVGFVRLGLVQEEAPDDEDDRRAGAEPEQRPPFVRRGADEATSKGSGEKIAKRVSLLQQTTHQTPGFDGDVLEGCGGGIAVEPSHGNAEESSASKELTIRLGETSALIDETVSKRSPNHPLHWHR
jgi:hypothetical protein